MTSPGFIPPALGPQPAPIAAEISSFGRQGDLPEFPLSIGLPGDPDLGFQTPCFTDFSSPYLEIYKFDDRIKLGERRYFFACRFPATPISATVTRSDGLIQSVELREDIPNPNLDKGQAQAVIDWPALPFYPTDPTINYTLVITDSSGASASFPFWVEPPVKEYILPVPQASSPGTTFLVYYVNFDLNTTPTFNLYGADQILQDGQAELTHRDSWPVSITQPLLDSTGKMKGWALKPLPSVTTDIRATYVITYYNKNTYEKIWLR
jgi:hypothetical protein